MVIAVNTSFTTGNLQERDFIAACFSILPVNYPQHQFIFIGEDLFTTKNGSAKNIIIINQGAPAKNPLLLQYRLNYKIRAILRKYKADVFVSSSYCSLRNKVPQCIIIHDLSFLQQTGNFSMRWLRFYKNNTVKFLSKAKHIVTTTQCLQQQIADKYNIPAGKITVCNYGVDKNFVPLAWQLKDNTKENYTAGKEYFLYSGTIEPGNDLVTLLKAFSFFKKRQKSNMQLVLATRKSISDKEFLKNLASYKYRDEVRVLENIPPGVLAQITASAYAVVDTDDSRQSFCLPLAEAIQAAVPVITIHNDFTAEICGDAALYIKPGNFNDIAEKMMLLFKDEHTRNELIIKGRQRVLENNYNWNKTAALLWESIVHCST
jgi:glycosyltransferase involved in cell wall biosynthesis